VACAWVFEGKLANSCGQRFVLFGGGQLRAWKPETWSLIERDSNSKPANFVAAKSSVCNVSKSSYRIAYIHPSAQVYPIPQANLMRPSNNSQPLIHRPPNRPERPLPALRPILGDCKSSRASFDFDSSAGTFANDDTTIDEQCAFAAEFSLVA
jgi:hypothetical protein